MINSISGQNYKNR